MRTSATPRLAAAAVLLAVALLSGCGGSKGKPATTTTTAAASARDRFGTTWLCRPGLADDPCVADLSTTVVTRTGATSVERSTASASPKVDCFYVYPTISDETTVNASLAVGFRLREVAVAQASRFSSACRVYAPVYRQITLSALDHPSKITLADALIAYGSVVSAFRDYLAHYNHGRGIVFIGHSQGATILIRLLQREVDRVPSVRRRLVSAILLGGNVTVQAGKTTGGDFAHIPACTAPGETGCVVAYSSFTEKPPPGSQFGRTTSNAGVDLLAPHNLAPGIRIMCVNPAAPAGGSALLDPYLPSLVLAFLSPAGAASVKTPWVAYPGEYTARCETSGDATWLQVTHAGGSDSRPVLTGLRDPTLGLHILDLNIALGDLVALVRREATAYR